MKANQEATRARVVIRVRHPRLKGTRKVYWTNSVGLIIEKLQQKGYTITKIQEDRHESVRSV